MTTDQRAAQDVRGGQLGASPATRTEAGSGAAWLVLAFLGLGGFLALTALVAGGAQLGFDHPILDVARTWTAGTTAWQLLSASANIPLIVIGVGMILWLFFTGRRKEALVVFLLLVAVTAGSEGVKQLTARPRPIGTDPSIPGVVYSYPSGHVLEALTIVGIIAIRCWRNLEHEALKVSIVVLVIAWVALVGIARIALGEHFPSDVLAGLFGGLGALGIYGWLTRPGGFADRPRDA
ncbi:MAG: undecaprenyl-diphosphatase [Chloroflexota bacterium]|jgi:undecaprenyl-diphosphatase|nr:undecaprenyl-diphosphatase [Chloroflexota bacterium]